MNTKRTEICYWCGIELSETTNKKEHVPPFGFFPKGYRNNLITVPSCEFHNNKFSKLDERFQLYIKSMGTNEISIDNFKTKVIKGLNRPESIGFVKDISSKAFKIKDKNSNSETLVFNIDPTFTFTFAEKVIRGIYFHIKKIPAKGKIFSYSTQITNPNFNNTELLSLVSGDTILNELISGDSKNPKVFDYKYIDLERYNTFFIKFTFYEGVDFYGFIIGNEEI